MSIQSKNIPNIDACLAVASRGSGFQVSRLASFSADLMGHRRRPSRHFLSCVLECEPYRIWIRFLVGSFLTFCESDRLAGLVEDSALSCSKPLPCIQGQIHIDLWYALTISIYSTVILERAAVSS